MKKRTDAIVSQRKWSPEEYYRETVPPHLLERSGTFSQLPGLEKDDTVFYAASASAHMEASVYSGGRISVIFKLQTEYTYVIEAHHLTDHDERRSIRIYVRPVS